MSTKTNYAIIPLDKYIRRQIAPYQIGISLIISVPIFAIAVIFIKYNEINLNLPMVIYSVAGITIGVFVFLHFALNLIIAKVIVASTSRMVPLEEVENSSEKMAKTLAHEIVGNAYKNLIHDLQIPVLAFRHYIKIIGHERASEEDRSNAQKRMVELAEQILNQVKSSKANFAVEVKLNDGDIAYSSPTGRPFRS